MISYMHTELKKYPKLQLVATVYATTTRRRRPGRQGLLQKYPKLKESSRRPRWILAAAQVVDAAHDIGKVRDRARYALEMKKYILNGTSPSHSVEPGELGYLAAYAAVNLHPRRSERHGQSFTPASSASSPSERTTRSCRPTTVFTKANVGSSASKLQQ